MHCQTGGIEHRRSVLFRNLLESTSYLRFNSPEVLEFGPTIPQFHPLARPHDPPDLLQMMLVALLAVFEVLQPRAYAKHNASTD